MLIIAGIFGNKMLIIENLLTFKPFYSFFGRMEKFSINKIIVK